MAQTKSDSTTVVIIGGGATGTGILRDLSMRGIPAVLFEQGGLCHGTSSRFHGLLHSGGRYAVSDREAAAECIRENSILRRIGRQCVDETEGFFVLTDEDDPSYVGKWVEGCKAAGITAQELSREEALRLEPGLNPKLKRVFQVPDAAVDGFRLVLHNAMSAERYGGTFHTYHEVLGITTSNGRVTGVDVRNKRTNATFHMACELIVNAAGSWSSRVASLAGLHVPLTPDKGTLIVFNHRCTNHVVNRLHKSSDGDIFVPNGSVTILGTTSQAVEDPADTSSSTDEALRLLALGRPLFPKIDSFRILRVFAGTRPLYTPGGAAGRQASRGFHISDHASEGVDGLLTIFGGKLTTYRLMAEKICDMVAARLNVSTPCRTAEEPLVQTPDKATDERAGRIFLAPALRLVADRLGDEYAPCVAASEELLKKAAAGHAAGTAQTVPANPLVCECEMVSMAELVHVARLPSTHSLHDLRLRTRLGMGTCQGTFCALRAASVLVEQGISYADDPLRDMRAFVQERWKGTRPVFWGQLAREMEFARNLYSGTLGTPSDDQEAPCVAPRPVPVVQGPLAQARTSGISSDAIVVGAGLAGLFAAWLLARDGRKVSLLAKGAGSLHITTAAIDVLGMTHKAPVTRPCEGMQALPATHPYRKLGTEVVHKALTEFAGLCSTKGAPLTGRGVQQGVPGPAAGLENSNLPTAIGTLKTSCLFPQSLDPAALDSAKRIVICGVEGLRDCMPGMAKANLHKLATFADKEIATVWLPTPWSGGCRAETALDVARVLERADCKDFLAALGRAARGADAVLIPAIAGTRPDNEVYAQLVQAAGCPVVEMTGLPPGVTGMRLGRLLLDALRRQGVTIMENTTVCGCERDMAGRVTALRTQHEDGQRRYVAEHFVIATGGIVSGGLELAPGCARDTVLGFEFALPVESAACTARTPFASQPYAFLGMPVTASLAPTLDGQTPWAENVRYAGRILAGQDPAFERSGNGIALATAYAAAMSLLAGE